MKKTFLFILGSVALGMSATTKDYPVKVYENPIAPADYANMKWSRINPSEFSASQNTGIDSKKKLKQSRSNEDQKLVTVTFTFPELGREWELFMNYLTVYNDKGYEENIEIEPYDEDWNPIPLTSWKSELPEGNYDFFARFEKVNPDMYYGFEAPVVYIAENVEVKEGTVIDLKPEESTICLTMLPTLPDGEKARFGELRYNEDWSYEIIEEGNITDDYVKKLILYKGHIIDNFRTNGGGWVILPGPHGSRDPYANCNVYVNQVSDNYTFRVIHTMLPYSNPEDGIYLAVTESNGANKGIYTNSGYTLETSSVLPTPAAVEYPAIGSEDDPVYPYGLTLWPEGSFSGSTLSTMNPNIWKVWNSAPENSDNNSLYYSYTKCLVDTFFEQGYFGLEEMTTTSQIFPFAEGGPMLCYFLGGTMRVIEEGEVITDIFPGNPGFMTPMSNVDMVAGQSAPLLLGYLYPEFDWNSETTINLLSVEYKGRLGETIDTDAYLAEMSLKFEGEEVAEGYSDIMGWMYDNSQETGKISIDISTNNFEIEGIKGGNVASINFDTSKEDSMPPAITMLQLRNDKDEITQTFTAPEKGRLLLSASDFTVKHGEPDPEDDGYIPSWFEFSQPEKVTAMCKPTGVVTESYEEIELTVQPDLFYTPGFGAFYEGTLAGVTQKSPTGWFDLTLTVEDAAGNYQTQTISPAFKIDSLTSSVETVISDKVIVRGNTIIAPADAQIYTIDGVRTNGTDLQTGIYIVHLADRTYKVSVK